MFHYCLREKQLRRFIRDAQKGSADKNWISQLAGRLELRLDNLVFRLGFAPGIRSARQMVAHGHILVNGKKVQVGSVVLNVGDVVSLKESSYTHQNYVQAKTAPRMELPDYLEKSEVNGKDTGKVKSVPGTEYIPFTFSANLFAEYYSLRSV